MTLVHGSESQDGFLADCTFRPQRLPVPPFGLALGRFNEAAAKPQAEDFVERQVKPLWTQLCGR
jgi:hypothetical protein